MLYVSNVNKDGTYSIKDTNLPKESPVHLTKEDLARIIQKRNMEILGVLYYPSVTVHAVEPDSISNCLVEPIISKIQFEDLRLFANLIRRLIPRYFFEVPASSSGKYHPACDLGKGGLVRHTIGVVRELIYITEIESTSYLFELTRREIDLMIIACMMHDSLKSGWQEDYAVNTQTRFDHPLLAANFVRGMQPFLKTGETEFIAHCIETHMGQWNTSSYSPVTLGKPADKYQWLVHLADYLASRREVNMIFDNTLYVLGDTNIVKIEDTTPTLSEKEIDILRKAFNRGVVNQEVKRQLGIERPDATCRDIWATLIKSGKCSEKQKKYLVLAQKSIGL